MKKANPFITSEEAAKLVALVKNIGDGLRKHEQQLTPKQRRALLKMRLGGDKTLAAVSQLVGAHNIQLPGASVEEMEQAAEAAAAVQPLLTALQAVTQVASDLVMSLQSTAWTHATLFYSVLNRLAKSNPQIATGLKSANELFERRSEAVLQERIARRARAKSEKAAKLSAKQAAKAAAKEAEMAAKRAGTQANAQDEADGASNGVANGASNGVTKNGVSNGVHAE